MSRKKIRIWMVMLLIMTIIGGCGKSVEQQIAEQLELGQKYLEDLNYEQAVVAFNKVIEIDAKVEEGYLGLAKAHKGMEDQKQAADVLELGIQSIGIEGLSEEYKNLMVDTYLSLAQENESSGDDTVAEMYYDRILDIIPDQNESLNQKKLLDKKRKLKPYYEELLEISKELNNDNASINAVSEVSSLLYNNEFLNIAESLEEPIVYRVNNELHLGIYPGGDIYYVYYGEMKDGMREGTGIWFYTFYQTEYNREAYVIFSGIWRNDYPNGEGKWYRKFLDSTGPRPDWFKETWYNGSLVDGYFNGYFEVKGLQYDGEIWQHSYTLNMGADGYGNMFNIDGATKE